MTDHASTTGQWIHRGGEPGWWFDSGALCLDFAHSVPSVDDQPSATADLSSWLVARFDQLDVDPGEREMIDARGLRDAIQRLMRARADGALPVPDDIDTVNLFAATPDIPPSMAGGQRQAGRSRIRATQALSSIARDAVLVLSHNDEGRIRECAADDCDLVFFDESRTNNRRWCSMQRCGNRAKVRAFRAKTAQ